MEGDTGVREELERGTVKEREGRVGKMSGVVKRQRKEWG